VEKQRNFSQNICMSQLLVIMDIYRIGIIYRCEILLIEKVLYFVKNKFSYENEREPHYRRCIHDTNAHCPPTDSASGLIIIPILCDRHDDFTVF
jgi:hypothetical protein